MFFRKATDLFYSQQHVTAETLTNQCTQVGVNRQNPAAIPKSGLEIKNRCTNEGINGEKLASILKSGLEIKVSVSAVTCCCE